MMYDLSVPRSAVARFSTPSSSQPAVPWPGYRVRIDGDARRKNGPNVFPSENLSTLIRYIARDASSIIPTDPCIPANKSHGAAPRGAPTYLHHPGNVSFAFNSTTTSPRGRVVFMARDT